jgi:hypothetical protein
MQNSCYGSAHGLMILQRYCIEILHGKLSWGLPLLYESFYRRPSKREPDQITDKGKPVMAGSLLKGKLSMGDQCNMKRGGKSAE